MRSLYFNVGILFCSLISTTYAGVGTDEGKDASPLSPTSSISGDSGYGSGESNTIHSRPSSPKNMKENEEIAILNSLSKSISHYYVNHLSGRETVDSFLNYSFPDIDAHPNGVINENVKEFSIENNGTLSNIDTLELIKYINHLISVTGTDTYSSEELRAFFSQVKSLTVSLGFNRWEGDHLGKGLDLEELKRFVSFFSSLENLNLQISAITSDFIFPIPDTLSTLRSLEYYMYKGTTKVPNEAKDKMWFDSWTNHLLKTIERNKYLTQLILSTPAVSPEYIDQLKQTVIHIPSLSNLFLFDPREDVCFSGVKSSDYDRYDQAVQSLYTAAPWITAGNYSGQS